MTVEIETSRDISAQIIRHKSFCFQEFSQRYSEVVGYESFDVRKQAEKNRQSSVEVLDLTDEEINQIQQHLVNGDNLYKYLLKKGAAKESARKLLPLCSKTTLYMTGSIRSWIHYLTLRYKEDTQLEHRLIANSIRESFIHIFPIISRALKWVEVVTEEKEEKENTKLKISKTNLHPRKNTFTAPLPESVSDSPDIEELNKVIQSMETMDINNLDVEEMEKIQKDLQRDVYSI
jgi:thymidylate synthase (FAD)